MLERSHGDVSIASHLERKCRFGEEMGKITTRCKSDEMIFKFVASVKFGKSDATNHFLIFGCEGNDTIT